MKIDCAHDEILDVQKLQPNPMNPNKHPKNQIEMLAKIIDYQGLRSPIVVSRRSGFIVKGHGRLEAVKKLGWTTVAVDFQDYENEAQEYADMIADNKIAELAETDKEILNKLALTFDQSFDFDLLGIPDFEIKKDLPGEDDVPAAPTTPKAKPGNLFILGGHRLICGDSTDPVVVGNLMHQSKAEITFTSPPYNLGENAKLRGTNATGDDTVYNESNDKKTQEDYVNFLCNFTAHALDRSNMLFCNIQLLAGNKIALAEYWHSYKNRLVDVIMWDKGSGAPAMAPKVLNSAFEFIFILSKDKNPTRAIKTAKEFRGTIPNIYRMNPNGKKDILAENHGAVFPVEFAQHFIENFSSGSVYEPFCGSGTTLIACEKLGRKCFAIEIDPQYVDVTIMRWQQQTGQKAQRVNDDGTFTDFNSL